MEDGDDLDDEFDEIEFCQERVGEILCSGWEGELDGDGI